MQAGFEIATDRSWSPTPIGIVLSKDLSKHRTVSSENESPVAMYRTENGKETGNHNNRMLSV